MKSYRKYLVVMLLTFGWLCERQSSAQSSFGLEVGQTAPLQVGAQFQFTRANAPPGQCGCFWMEGGGVEITRSFSRAWGANIDVYYGRASQLNKTDEQISIFNYLAGPRYTYRTETRYTPYAQALVGASKVSSNYYAYKSGNSYLAAQAGLGVEVWVTRHLSVPLQADWVYSRAVNGLNARQNNTRLGVGVIYRLGPK
ncbi:MAG: outer membrane beta-barrel protein [Rhodospirillales bacterium]|nr:outer membrane beta-barrel protein [Acetobacter sp.]